MWASRFTGYRVAPPSIRLWILKPFESASSCRKSLAVAPPSIRLWILKQPNGGSSTPTLGGCTPFDPLVDTETLLTTTPHFCHKCCTPFDPLVDTETFTKRLTPTTTSWVAPPSIRLWILKHKILINRRYSFTCCTPFDPLVDTETWDGRFLADNFLGCTPFDPLVDTETYISVHLGH